MNTGIRKNTLSLVLSALLLTSAFSVAAHAQQTQGEEQHQKDKQPNEGANHAQDSDDRSAPGASTTGSGAATGPSHPNGAAPANSSSPAGQPETATGEDLKGPPTRFAPNKTPE